jgi:hypothetical protein
MKKTLQKLLALGVLVVLPLNSNAVIMTVDEIIYEDNGATNPSVLSGTVDMNLIGNELSIVLTNTSSAVASPTASHNLLTGLGFVLPEMIAINWGTATITSGSTAINFTAPANGDVSGEWGYDTNPLDSGPFQNANITSSSVNTVVSTMESSTTTKFSNTPIENPAVLAGPEFGLLSDLVDAEVAGGQNAIQDSITILLNLSGLAMLTGEYSLLDFIQSNDIVLSFGSPNSSSIPEPSAMVLLAIGLLGFAGIRVNAKHKS